MDRFERYSVLLDAVCRTNTLLEIMFLPKQPKKWTIKDVLWSSEFIRRNKNYLVSAYRGSVW